MSSLSGTLYIGVTGDLDLRVWQHKTGAFEGFSKKILLHPFGIPRGIRQRIPGNRQGKAIEGLEKIEEGRAD